MSACVVGFIKCDPEGNKIVEMLDGISQTKMYFLDGVMWTGDPATLTDCAGGVDTFVTLTDNGDGTGSITSADGATVLQVCLAPCDFTVAEDNGDGTYKITMPDGTSVDIVTNHWVEYVVFDPTVHVPGTVIGDGTQANPFQVPLPGGTIEITDIAITNTVVGADGSTTVTYTVTEEDDGDGDPPTHSFDVVFPASAEINFVYVAYNPDVHADGAVVGDGTAAAPFQIPLPCCDQFVYVPYDPAVHADGGLTGDGSTASPFQIPLPPPGTTDSFVKFAENVDGSVTFTSADGLSSVTVCNDCAHASAQSNGDSTITITNTDGSNVNALESVLVNAGGFGLSRPVDPDVDILLHEGNIADGTATDPATTVPVQKLADGSLATEDFCAKTLPAGECSTVTGLVTDNCETVSPDDLIPTHVFGQCTQPGGDITPSSDVAGEVISDLTATELDRGQVGTRVVNPSPTAATPNIPPNTFPLTIPIPAANPDCVLGLQVTWGGARFSDSTIDDPSVVLGTGSDYSNPTLTTLMDINVYGDHEAGGTGLWLFDPVTGSAGSDIVLDFAKQTTDTSGGGDGPLFDGDIEGVVQWYWVEICDAANTVQIRTADFDIGGLQTAITPAFSAPNESVESTTSVDLGDCPGVYFAAGRHIADSPIGGGDFSLHVDTDWFQANNAGVDELYDTTSHNSSSSCQMGSSFGTVAANSGAWTYNATANNFGTLQLPDPTTTLAALRLTDCNNVGGSTASNGVSAQCEIPITNPNCRVDGVVRCTMRASIKICVGPGDSVDVTPVFSGAQLVDQTVSVDNTNGASTVCVTHAVTPFVTDFANPVAPGGTALTEMSWISVGSSIHPDTNVSVSDWSSECELIHI